MVNQVVNSVFQEQTFEEITKDLQLEDMPSFNNEKRNDFIKARNVLASKEKEQQSPSIHTPLVKHTMYIKEEETLRKEEEIFGVYD